MGSPHTERAISVFNRQHLNVWKRTSALLPTHVETNYFVFYVPKNEILDFKRVSKLHIKVLSERDVPHVRESIKKISDSGNSNCVKCERLGKSQFNRSHKPSSADLGVLGQKQNLDIFSLENHYLRGILGKINYVIIFCQHSLSKQIVSKNGLF